MTVLASDNETLTAEPWGRLVDIHRIVTTSPTCQVSPLFGYVNVMVGSPTL